MAGIEVNSLVTVHGRGTVVEVSLNFVEVQYSILDDVAAAANANAMNRNRRLRNAPQLEHFQVGQSVTASIPGKLVRIEHPNVIVRYDDGIGLEVVGPNNNNNANNNFVQMNNPALANLAAELDEDMENNAMRANFNELNNIANNNRPLLQRGDPLRANAPVYVPFNGRNIVGGTRKTRNKRKSKKTRKGSKGKKSRRGQRKN